MKEWLISSDMSRDQKIKILKDYAQDCNLKGFRPTKRGIRKKFHLEIYNYFSSIGDFHAKSGIEVSLRDYPKEIAKDILVNYVRQKAEEDYFPNRKEIEKEFKIHFSYYFKNLYELYKSANISLFLIENAVKNKILAAHTYPSEIINQQKSLIKSFIKENVQNGQYPSVQQIQKNLNLSFYNLYSSIIEAYSDAKVKYERPSPILLGKKKEKIFTMIIKELMIKMGYQIKRVSLESEIDFNRHADITVIDGKGEYYLVEIKAYREDLRVSDREFLQLSKYLKKDGISRGIFITTANTQYCKFENIKFINGTKVIFLLRKYHLNKYIKLIAWIQKSRINSKERARYLENIKKEILHYIKIKGKMPTKREIEKTFKVDIRSIYGKKQPYKSLLYHVEKSGALTPRV